MKKCLTAMTVLASVSMFALTANAGPYLGADVGAQSTTSTVAVTQAARIGGGIGSSSINMGSRGIQGGVFGGYSTIVDRKIYLAGEVFAKDSNTEAQASNFDKDSNAVATENVTLRTKYSYGFSFIPGLMINAQTLAFLRLGIVETRFENNASASGNIFGVNFSNDASASKTVTGGQIGGGIQADLTRHLALRGEYVYTTYKTFSGASGHIRAFTDQFNLGLLYHFD